MTKRALDEPHTHGLTCRLLTEESAWSTIREDWERLYAITPGVTPWQSWDFLSRWWQHMRGHRQLRIVVVEQDGLALLLVPLQLDRQTPFRLRVLEPIGMPDDINRPKLAIGAFHPLAFKTALLELWRRRFEWDALRVDEKTLDDDELGLLRDFEASHPANMKLVPFHPCPFLRLPESWETYIRERGTRLAKNLRSSRRSIEARGRIEAEQFDDEAAVMQAYDALIELHNRSWKYQARIGLSQSDNYRAFYRSFVARMAQRGQARAWILSCDGAAIAATLAFHENGIYYSTQIAHDAAFAKSSPGTLLESIELEHLIHEAKFRTYDFLGGALSNKRRWTDAALQTQRIWLIRPSFRGRIFETYYFKIKPLAKNLRHTGKTRTEILSN